MVKQYERKAAYGDSVFEFGQSAASDEAAVCWSVKCRFSQHRNPTPQKPKVTERPKAQIARASATAFRDSNIVITKPADQM
jgi:hypothetical protein